MKMLSMELDDATYELIKSEAEHAAEDVAEWTKQKAVEAANRARASRRADAADSAAILRRGAEAVSDPAWKDRFRRAAEAAEADSDTEASPDRGARAAPRPARGGTHRTRT